MADIIDDAQQKETMEREAALAAAAEKNKPQKHPDFDGTHCIDCLDALPSARLHLGKIRCVYCQEVVEFKERRP